MTRPVVGIKCVSSVARTVVATRKVVANLRTVGDSILAFIDIWNATFNQKVLTFEYGII